MMRDGNDNTQMKIILIVGMGTTLGMAVLALLLGVAVQVLHHYHHHHKLNLYIIVSLSQTYLFTHFRQWHSPAKACKSFFLVIFWFMFGILFFCAAVGYSGENFGLSIIQRDQKAVSLSLFRGGGSSNLSPNVKCEMRPTNCYPGFTKVIPVLSQVCLSKRLQSFWKS